MELHIMDREEKTMPQTYTEDGKHSPDKHEQEIERLLPQNSEDPGEIHIDEFKHSSELSRDELSEENIAVAHTRKEELQSVDREGRMVLHKACDSGNKTEVLKLLAELKEYGILKEELLRCDNSGRTALCLARNEKKEKRGYKVGSGIMQTFEKYKRGPLQQMHLENALWAEIGRFARTPGESESVEEFKCREDTAKAMWKWIWENAPDIKDEVNQR